MSQSQLKAVLIAVDKISPTLRGVSKSVRLLNKSFVDISNAGAKISRQLSIPAVVSFSAVSYGAINAAKSAIEYADSIQDAADRTGASTDSYQALSNMLLMTGGSSEDAEMALTKFNKGVADAAAGADKNFAALMKKLNIPIKDASGNLVGLADVLPQLAKGFAANKSPAIQTRMAMELWGKGGTNMIILMNELASGSISLSEAMKNIVDKKSIGDLSGVANSLDILKIQTKNTLTGALAKIVPAIQPIIESMTNWVSANRQLIQSSITNALKEIVSALNGLDWKQMFKDLKSIVSNVKSFVVAIGGIKTVLIGIGVALISGPLAAILSIGGALFRLGSGFIAMAGGWAKIGAVAMRVVGAGKSLISILALIGKSVLLIGRAILLNPLGIAISVLAAGAYLVYKNWDKIKVWWQEFSGWIGSVVSGIAAKISGIVPDWVKTLFSGNSNFAMTSTQVAAPMRSSILSNSKMNGEMTVRFENAPQGMRVNQGKTNQPGFGINADVGYNPLSIFSG